MSAGGRYRRGLYARAFGAVLREHRERAGITQEELAFRGGSGSDVSVAAGAWTLNAEPVRDLRVG